MCRQTKMRKPILYEREFKLPPFRPRPLWGTPRVGKGGGGGVLALVEHVERLDRAEPWSWLRERGLLAGGWPWWPGRPWRAPGASEAGGCHSRGTGLRADPRESLYGPHRVQCFSGRTAPRTGSGIRAPRRRGYASSSRLPGSWPRPVSCCRTGCSGARHPGTRRPRRDRRRTPRSSLRGRP